MVLMSGMDLPVRAIREQIASAVDLIVHIARFSDGTRKVTRVTEVVGLEGEQVTMQDIFEYVQTGLSPAGQVLGFFRPTGAVPTFVEGAAAKGLEVDRTIFDPLGRGEGGG
jgi:pilus assembly protein CpaF